MPSDAVFHTGIDEAPDGIFDNETNEETKELLQEQDKKIKELSPWLDSLIKEVDAEIARTDKISDIPNALNTPEIPEASVVSEMAARARYIQFLQNWKMKFGTALEDLKNGKRK